jgi:hypothetical protein
MIWDYSNIAHLLNEIISIPKRPRSDYINQAFELERMRIKQISTQASSDNYIALI